MMNAYRFEKMLLLVSLGILGCGGGGGGGDDSLIAGVWNGSVAIVERGCASTSDNEFYYSFTHLVNQSGDDVVLDNGARTFSGTASSEDSFRVETVAPFPGNTSCQETLQWRYDRIEETQAPFVVRTQTITCPNGATGGTCRTTWSGSAFRPGRPIGGPIPLFEDGSVSAPTAINEPGVEVIGDPSVM